MFFKEFLARPAARFFGILILIFLSIAGMLMFIQLAPRTLADTGSVVCFVVFLIGLGLLVNEIPFRRARPAVRVFSILALGFLGGAGMFIFTVFGGQGRVFTISEGLAVAAGILCFGIFLIGCFALEEEIRVTRGDPELGFWRGLVSFRLYEAPFWTTLIIEFGGILFGEWIAEELLHMNTDIAKIYVAGLTGGAAVAGWWWLWLKFWARERRGIVRDESFFTRLDRALSNITAAGKRAAQIIGGVGLVVGAAGAAYFVPRFIHQTLWVIVAWLAAAYWFGKGLRMAVKGLAGPGRLTGETTLGPATTATQPQAAERERGGNRDPIHKKRF
jgi:hypothetical protein